MGSIVSFPGVLAHVVDRPATAGCLLPGKREEKTCEACACEASTFKSKPRRRSTKEGEVNIRILHVQLSTRRRTPRGAPCTIGKRPGQWRGEWLHGSGHQGGACSCLPACPTKGLRFLMGRRLNLRRRAPAREANPGSAAPISDGDAGTGGSAGLLGGQGPPVSTNTTPLPETRRLCPLHTCSSGQPTLESPTILKKKSP